jgi:hypothetical protein
VHAFFRLIHVDPGVDTNKNTILRGLSFLTYLLRMASGQRSASQVLEGLGWRHQDEVETLNDWFIRCFFPGINLASYGFEDDAMTLMLGGPDEMMRGVWPVTLQAFRDIGRHWRFFETGSGYLGVAPRGTEEGDVLCVLKGCGVPVTLRNTSAASGNRFTLVGTCFVVSLMNGEAVKFIQQGKSTPEMLEIE